MCYIYHGEGLLYHGEVFFLFYHGLNGLDGLDGFLSYKNIILCVCWTDGSWLINKKYP